MQTKLQQAFALHQQGRLPEAERAYEEIIRRASGNFDALHLLGVVALQTGRPQRGVELITQAIACNPGVAEAHNNLGNGLRELKRHNDALLHFNRAISLKPNYAEAFYNRGISMHELEHYSEALDSYAQAIALMPGFPDAYNNRGNTLRELARFEEALLNYDHAIEINPRYVEAYDNRASLFCLIRQFDNALTSCDRSIELNPMRANAHNSRGNVLMSLERFDEALASYDRAVMLSPSDERTHNNRSNALSELKRFRESLDGYDRAIALSPEFAEAYNNRGNVLRALGEFDAALASYDRAISLRPDFERAYYNRGVVLNELRRHEEALAEFAKAMALKPDLEFLRGNLIHTKMMICDWTDLETQINQLVHVLTFGESVVTPFSFLSMSNDPALQRMAAERFAQVKYPSRNALSPIAKRPKKERIRIGYFSADFRIHAVAILSAQLFERHDRARFEILAFSFGSKPRDEMTERLELAFDRFIDVSGQSDEQVTQLARDLEIDIAVDLGGLTTDSRTAIFAMRAAPIQISFLGYPGTMGTGYIDYLIADPILIPSSQQEHYREKIIYLPDSYMPSDSSRAISDRRFCRPEFGLPQAKFVFCCFNNSYKFNPDTFDRWARILKRKEESVLWLSFNNAASAANLRKELATRGVSPDRLVFAERLPLAADHLARNRLADLFLDTSPYNAHTTANDALWCGLPVLTLKGETFAGRVAASLLNAIGLPELIASTPREYEALAVELADNSAKLAEFRSRLARYRLVKPLFNAERFTRHLEAAFTAVYERHLIDLPPEHIYLRGSSAPSWSPQLPR